MVVFWGVVVDVGGIACVLRNVSVGQRGLLCVFPLQQPLRLAIHIMCMHIHHRCAHGVELVGSHGQLADLAIVQGTQVGAHCPAGQKEEAGVG